MELVKNSKPRRKRADLSVKKLRSAITNGSHVLLDIDHRSAPMRRLRDLIMLHESDLGGTDLISEAERSLVRRASVIELQLELLEHRFAEAGGEATASQLMDYQRATGALRRILEGLGLRRRPRALTIDGRTVEEPFSPMRSRWAAEAAAAAAAVKEGSAE